MGEGPTVQWNVSKKMSLVIGARRHLEWGHEKYIVDTIQSHPAQVDKFFIKFASYQAFVIQLCPICSFKNL